MSRGRSPSTHTLRVSVLLFGILVFVAGFATPVAAHAGSLAGSLNSVPAPFWLVVVAGGGIVGASFLVSVFVTDDEALGVFVRTRARIPLSVGALETLLRIAGVVVLLAVVGFGLFGPSVAFVNLGVLLVWVFWWAGFTMFTYLVVDIWPLVNPWRTLADAVRRWVSVPSRTYPERLGAWPSVAGLLGLVWLEVVSPLASDPRALAGVVLAYSAVTVAGALLYGETWFDRVDPVSRVFRLYGLLAPIQRTDRGLSMCLPGSALARYRTVMRPDDVAFVVALLWVTTYDGLVATRAWQGVLDTFAFVPGWLVAFVTAVGGFVGFFVAYRLSSKFARQTAETYVTPAYIAGWFAPALVPIAAGYHLAHFAGYVFGLSPVLVAVATNPLSPPAALQVFVLPSWLGSLQLAFVVLGHLLAVWIAHTRSFELFTGRLQPLRSQYPFVVVTVAYTMTSLWVVAQPTVSGGVT
ncbi:hypothetical protein ACFQJC_07960 [Haloferax namakaokahaiae]|uniref:Uncharacterized protein n=1 Tax=Haloferax namakaokahaiae TaxID=1748331 RepID=A0ABD5ZE16_9EURY